MVSYSRGEDYPYTVGLIENTTYEDAYPSLAINTPADGLITYIDGVAYGSNDTAALISVSSIYATTDSEYTPVWICKKKKAWNNEHQLNNNSQM